MSKRLLTGFVLGAGVGALYHYTHKHQADGQDPLYRLVGQADAQLREKLAESAGERSGQARQLLDSVAARVGTQAQQVAAKVGDAAAKAADKTAATAQDLADKTEATAKTAASKGKRKVDEVSSGS